MTRVMSLHVITLRHHCALSSCLFLACLLICAGQQDTDMNIYAELLVGKYGSNGVISASGMDSLVSHVTCDTHQACSLSNSTTTECLCMGEGLMSHLGYTDTVSIDQLPAVAAAILYAAQNTGRACAPGNSSHEEREDGEPRLSEVWGYSFLCVTLINLCSLTGMLFIPLMKKQYYQKLLMFMVALAVGTLTGSSLLFLIPGAFGLGEEGSPYRHEYVKKMSVVISGIYLFFLVERLLQNFLGHTNGHVHQHTDEENSKAEAAAHSTAHNKPQHNGRQRTTSGCSVISEGEEPLSSIKFHTVSRAEESMNMSFKVPHMIQAEHPEGHTGDDHATSPTESMHGLLTSPIPTAIVSNGATSPSQLSPVIEETQKIKSVAWMIIFGDGLHNFIDGLSIGAAFAGSTLAGISVSLAVICEELPHELGDFAILLDAGMTIKRALMYNFLSACMCYIGLVVGILVGELQHGSQWIFAIAGGMFLYIALCDMLPEVNHAGEEEARLSGKKWRVFLLQNAGLLTGFFIMLILALYAEKISLEA